MTKLIFLLAIALNVTPCWCVEGAHAPQVAPKAADSLVLDGAKNPELFPEWYVWELVFQRIARGAFHSKEPIHAQLGINAREFVLIEQETALFENYEKALETKLRDTRSALKAKGKSEDEIRDATHEHNMEYRYKVLEARDRVVRGLSTESNQRIREWINRQLAGTKVHLSGRAAKVFHLPR